MKITEIHWVLPFGNEGRGTKVYLWPFLVVAAIAIAAPIIDAVIS